MNTLLLSVPGMTCDHCVRAVSAEVGALPGVETVDVSLATKAVRVTGSAAEAEVRAAVAEAGYEAV